MNTSKLNQFILALIFILASIQTQASHIMGGEVTYRWLSGNDYLVSLNLYRDCSGIPAPTTGDIAVFSTSCQDSFIVNLPEVSFDQLTPACNNVVTTCNGGVSFGFERHFYSDTVTLPFTCYDWKFVFAECCRNATITNLNNGSGYGAYFYTGIDNLNVLFNNSPVFTAEPIIFLSTTQNYTLNNGIFDPDGDSLVISLSPALDGNIFSPSVANAIPYNPGYSYLNPVTAVTPLTIDPFTGTISVTPTITQVCVVVYQVDEYRNGALIGTTTRDLQVIIQGGSNQLPSLSGINNTGNFITNVCYNDTLQFNINSFDADVNDSLAISWHSFSGSKNGGSNYSFVTAGIKQDSATFTFIPDISMIGSQPYFLYVSVKDDVCPYYGLQTYCYVIYVNSCSQDVWPGDANSDLAANLYDILPIGLAFNNTGPVRTGASLSWIPQPATDWTGSFFSGVNHKHADCNGDGVVNLADTLAISLNYGLTHPAKATPEIAGKLNVADFYLIASPDTAAANSIINIKIGLGTSAVPVDSIYGIAFRINFNPGIIDTTSGTMDYTGSWMGTAGTDLITFSRPFISNGYIDVAMVRNNHQNISGDSLIAIFSIVIVDNIAGKIGLGFNLSDVYAITYAESVLGLNIIGDSVIVSSSTGINDQQDESDITIYPTPASEYLIISSSSNALDEIILSDLSGRVLVRNTYNKAYKSILDLKNISSGLYSIQIKTTKGTVNKRILVTGK